MILVDTREQLPLWNKNDGLVIKQKLDEGDYTTDRLFNKAHAERKSAMDLYGSMIRGHKRFCAEIQRAIDKDLSFAVFVECSEKKFIAKRFKGGKRLKVNSKALGKIVRAFKSNYPIDFIWCKNREDMKKRILEWFANETEK